MPRAYTWASKEVFARLQNRFQLADYALDPSNAFWVPHYVQPVTNVDELLRTPDVLVGTTTGLTGTGQKVVYTVAKGKRLTLMAYYMAQSGGDKNLQGIRLLDPAGHGIIVQTQTAAISIKGELTHGYILDEDWQIGTDLSAGVADSQVAYGFYVLVEDSFN